MNMDTQLWKVNNYWRRAPIKPASGIHVHESTDFNFIMSHNSLILSCHKSELSAFMISHYYSVPFIQFLDISNLFSEISYHDFWMRLGKTFNCSVTKTEFYISQIIVYTWIKSTWGGGVWRGVGLYYDGNPD